MRIGIAVLTLTWLGLTGCTPGVVSRDGGNNDRRWDAAADANVGHDGPRDAAAPGDRLAGTDQNGRDLPVGTDHTPGVDHSSGSDSAAGVDHCTPDCTSKHCGDDNGCGGHCLSCANGNERCNTGNWSCSAVCIPDCTSKFCGDSDGCSGTCTACSTAGQGCDPGTGTCSACGLDCGPGGSCFYNLQGQAECQCGSGYYHNYSTTSCTLSAGTPCEGIDCGSRGTCKYQFYIGTSCSCNPGYVQWDTVCLPENKMGCRDRDNTFKERSTTRCSLDDSTIEVCWDGNDDGIVEWTFGATPSCGAGNTCSACINAGCNVNAGGMNCPRGTYCMASTHELEVWQCVTACDCTNCSDCSYGNNCYQGMQAFCGNCSASPALAACKWPCPSAGDGCIPYTDSASGAVGLCYPMEGCFSAVPTW